MGSSMYMYVVLLLVDVAGCCWLLLLGVSSSRAQCLVGFYVE